MSDTGQGELPGDFLDLVDLYCSGLIDDDGFPPARGDSARERGGAASFRRRISITTPRSSSRFARAARPMRFLISSRPRPDRPRRPRRPRPSVARREFGRAGGSGSRPVALVRGGARRRLRIGVRIGPVRGDRGRRRAASPGQYRLAGQRPGLPVGGPGPEAEPRHAARQGAAAGTRAGRDRVRPGGAGDPPGPRRARARLGELGASCSTER